MGYLDIAALDRLRLQNTSVEDQSGAVLPFRNKIAVQNAKGIFVNLPSIVRTGVLVVLTVQVVTAETSDPAGIEFFEKKIRPVLVERCYKCHSLAAKQDDKLKGGLLLDSRESIRAGGDSGPAVVPGKPEVSLLIESIRYDADSLQMPPDGKLPSAVIADFERWVETGAADPRGGSPATAKDNNIDWDEARRFWSFVPAKRQPLPTVADRAWSQGRIDRFILARLESNNLQPSPETNRATLIRRLSFNLIGLPPTPNEVRSFVSDPRPDAYERLVDRLLQSPEFGERWARFWLDLARYTDKTASWLEGMAQAHLYRDWVVSAMNRDVPYNDFVHRQLATDLLEETGPLDIPALGFLGLSPTYWKELMLPSEIIKVIVADEWEERVDVVSRSFLGLTVACARCHDHKFDPISIEDYYALAGVISSCRLAQRPLVDAQSSKCVNQARAEVARLEAEITDLKKKKPVPQNQIDEYLAKIKQIIESTPQYDAPTANAIADETLYVLRKGKTAQEGTKLEYRAEPRDLNIFIRGNPNQLGPKVQRRFLRVLSFREAAPFTQGSGRLELARAITGDAASLAARVIVNRIWLLHFGRGLVTTPSNFGKLGRRPSHPELLEDLAARFMARGWSLKKLHREIVLSATFRQSSQLEKKRQSIDPDNQWLGRMNRKRLDLEPWRDAMLAVSGQLERKIGGASQEIEDPKNRRRTLYATIHRRDMSKMLQIHDFPNPTSHSPQRINTTTPLQGLYVLNGSLLATQAQALAERISEQSVDDSDAGNLEQQIRAIYWLLFSREPSARDLQLGTDFMGQKTGDARKDAWVQYAHVLLGLNEFLYVD